ncbi:MAG: permease [Candidatus Omnitrophica bacterium]|nr:permease [Candidatus Omnitrophota bacterium]
MFLDLIFAGLLALKDYILHHILTCLIPAFLLAGGMVSFFNKEAILNYLGEKASKLKSFSLATFFSFFIASCSCTVLPVGSGLYFAGAGIGASFIILWVAPSTNVLSLLFTGNILGAKMAISRITASLFMAFLVGWIMSIIFGKEERNKIKSTSLLQKKTLITKKHSVLLILIFLSIILPNYIAQGRSYLTNVLVWSILTVIWLIYATNALTKEEVKNWLRETWWFVRMIVPLLLVGAFIVGVIGKLLPKEFVSKWVGGNSPLAAFLATLSGQLMYFGTLTESPFIDTMLKLGMGKGPALAFLLTGPGMSLPNMLAIGRLFGIRKAAVYIILIMTLGTFVGWFFGNFIF